MVKDMYVFHNTSHEKKIVWNSVLTAPFGKKRNFSALTHCFVHVAHRNALCFIFNAFKCADFGLQHVFKIKTHLKNIVWTHLIVCVGTCFLLCMQMRFQSSCVEKRFSFRNAFKCGSILCDICKRNGFVHMN